MSIWQKGRWWTTHTMDPTQSSPLFLSKLLFLGTASLHMGGPWQYWRLSPWYRSPLIVADGPPIKLEPRLGTTQGKLTSVVGGYQLSHMFGF